MLGACEFLSEDYIQTTARRESIWKMAALSSNRSRRRARQRVSEFISGTNALKITYPGTNNFTSMTYDGLGRCVKIVETINNVVTSTKQFVWCGNSRCEERDGSGVLKKQFFGLGQRNNIDTTPVAYFYTKDHLGSVRELTDSSAVIQAQYAYSPWGEATKLQGAQDADFGFAGYYVHSRSGLNITQYRAYNTGLGRWLSRDPAGEMGGLNLYAYVGNTPTTKVDPLGLGCQDPEFPSCIDNYPDCVAWCNQCKGTDWASIAWRLDCEKRCFLSFGWGPPPLPKNEEGNARGGSRPGDFVPWPIPGTPGWTWPGIETPWGPVPIIPIPIPAGPVPVLL
jgi:RHS repeat-associated protein